MIASNLVIESSLFPFMLCVFPAIASAVQQPSSVVPQSIARFWALVWVSTSDRNRGNGNAGFPIGSVLLLLMWNGILDGQGEVLPVELVQASVSTLSRSRDTCTFGVLRS